MGVNFQSKLLFLFIRRFSFIYKSLIIELLCVGAIVIGFFAALLILVCKLHEENIPNVLKLESRELVFDYVIGKW